MEEYENKEAGLTFIAKINEDRVSLRIPSEKDGWKLRAFKSLEVKIHLCSKSSDVSFTVAERIC